MKAKNLLVSCLTIFGIALVANILITLGWNYFVKNQGLTIDWETSIKIALILAIVIPLAHRRR